MQLQLYRQMSLVHQNNQGNPDLLKKLDHISIHNNEDKSRKGSKFAAFSFDKNKHTKYTMPACHFNSFNLWILKPTHLNRGRGIHVFRDLDTLSKLIKQYCSGRELDVLEKKQTKKEYETDKQDELSASEETPSKKHFSPSKMKFNTFIIQKYIEKPLLIHKRKFDIRVWVCLTQD